MTAFEILFIRLLIAVGDAGDPWASVLAVACELGLPGSLKDDIKRELDQATHQGYLARSTDQRYRLTGMSLRLLYSS
jgi:hypothetical protein